VLVEPRPRRRQRPSRAGDVILFEARGEKPADLRESGAGVAGGVAEERPERAEDLDDLIGVATIHPSEKPSDSAEERTHHLAKPVIDGGSEIVDTSGRPPGRLKFAQELLDACDQRIRWASPRDRAEREERVLERACRIVRHRHDPYSTAFDKSSAASRSSACSTAIVDRTVLAVLPVGRVRAFKYGSPSPVAKASHAKAGRDRRSTAVAAADTPCVLGGRGLLAEAMPSGRGWAGGRVADPTAFLASYGRPRLADAHRKHTY
jgi:hypothetical protein